MQLNEDDFAVIYKVNPQGLSLDDDDEDDDMNSTSSTPCSCRPFVTSFVRLLAINSKVEEVSC